MSLDLLVDGEGNARQFLFAHGAGAPMDSPFMNDIAAAMASRNVEVVRFEFPYMAGRRSGKRRAPDRSAVLLQTWQELIERRRDGRPLFIGGKSMGGRYATMIAGQVAVDGVICFGYPFHPPGDSSKTRVDHLQQLSAPLLILQGSRDSLGSRAEVESYCLPSSIDLVWFEGADHSLQLRRSDKSTPIAAAERAAAFIERRSASSPG